MTLAQLIAAHPWKTLAWLFLAAKMVRWGWLYLP